MVNWKDGYNACFLHGREFCFGRGKLLRVQMTGFGKNRRARVGEHLSHRLARWSLEVDIDKYHQGRTMFLPVQNISNCALSVQNNVCPLCVGAQL